jgi:hypothetical protein
VPFMSLAVGIAISPPPRRRILFHACRSGHGSTPSAIHAGDTEAEVGQQQRQFLDFYACG